MTSTSTSIQPDSGRQGTLFCVDCAEYMFHEDDKEKQSHILITLKAIRKEMNMMCCSADLRQMVGIIFFNTGKTNIKAESLDNIFLYRNMVEYKENGFMKALDADAVKQIDELIKDDAKREDFFGNTLGGSGQCDYAQLLWLIRRNFQYDLKAQKKVALVFTRNQLLEDYSKALIGKIKIEIGEAKTSGIELTHMLLGEEEIGEHWNDLDVNIEVFDTAENLSLSVKRKNIARRQTTSLPLQFGNNIHLAVSVFYLIVEQKLETGVYLNEKTNNLVQQKTRMVKQPGLNEMMSLSRIIQEEGSESSVKRETVDPKKVKLKQNIGGVDIELNKEELEKFKRIDNPGIYIIGFKPMKYLKWSHHVGATQYLFPNESLTNGSSLMYRALYTRCLERNLFILARYCLKKNIMPKLVALVPQSKGDETQNKNKNLFYEGFHVVHLPYAEDKRNLQSKLEGDWPDATKDQVNAAEAFVKKLTTDYSPEKYTNPTLQKHYWVLEGLATENDDYPEGHQFDQIKPYFEKTPRGKTESAAFEKTIFK